MHGSDQMNPTNTGAAVSPEVPTIIQTDVGTKDGQNKCPKCGSTEISPNNNGLLRCNFCRHEFAPEKALGVTDDVKGLEGLIIGSGADDIIADVSEILTFKCVSCGAEVVIDTAEAMHARCHWCRNTLSVNQQIPNGAVPDMVLPFYIQKQDAKNEIEKFVAKRMFYAHPKFKAEFTTANIMGVYLPYMVVDVNAHASLKGQGEIQTRRYSVGDSTYYDADVYNVERDFDLYVNDLTVESSSDKLNNVSEDKTNNIINAIMPFDTNNCVKWDANYLRGYTSEKRDTNIEQLRGLVHVQTKDIARHQANAYLKQYDRGVCWANEQLIVKGERWHSAYLPVWLYSYHEVQSNNKQVLHYVAVNARTKETMGSVPINIPRLLLISFIVEIIGIFLFFIVAATSSPDSDSEISLVFLLSGFVYYGIIYAKYRNKGARHVHEAETDTKVENVGGQDVFARSLKKLSNSRMTGANNLSTSNKTSGNGLLDSLTNKLPQQVPQQQSQQPMRQQVQGQQMYQGNYQQQGMYPGQQSMPMNQTPPPQPMAMPQAQPMVQPGLEAQQTQNPTNPNNMQ